MKPIDADKIESFQEFEYDGKVIDTLDDFYAIPPIPVISINELNEKREKIKSKRDFYYKHNDDNVAFGLNLALEIISEIFDK